ncbi:hypothetical protein [Psychrobacter sp. FME5]|uniref:hypothetical protein n=1 Tax=Psychrobacter sp. FME5 TaxID=2487706 RepID=UPI00178806F0|nr:hypothetical protein [Psychrobacter sp. FME5]MBE0444982.1 hypothetical protein [Psychrobacter sp. FME5]
MNQVTPIHINNNQTNSHSNNSEMPDTFIMADNFASHAKGKKGLSRIVNAAGYSLDGFKAAYKFGWCIKKYAGVIKEG